MGTLRPINPYATSRPRNASVLASASIDDHEGSVVSGATASTVVVNSDLTVSRNASRRRRRKVVPREVEILEPEEERMEEEMKKKKERETEQEKKRN